MELGKLSEVKISRKSLSNVKIKSSIVDNIQLWILALPAVLLIFIFRYLPMGGIVIAFKRFTVQKGIFGSDWVGFENFKFFFTSQDAKRVLTNTLYLNTLFIVIGTVMSIIFALMLFEIMRKNLVKLYQTVFVVPSLVSWVVVGFISYALLQPQKGLINGLLRSFGAEGIQWYAEPKYWPSILLFFSLWKGLGMSCLFYYASLMGIDDEMFEAARLDGANRLQISWYISIPFLIPTIVILTILNIGHIFQSDFGLFYNITQDAGALYSTTDVIDTYIYRALSKNGNFEMSAAVGLFQSAVGFVLVIITNSITKKIDPSKSLF